MAHKDLQIRNLLASIVTYIVDGRERHIAKKHGRADIVGAEQGTGPIIGTGRDMGTTSEARLAPAGLDGA